MSDLAKRDDIRPLVERAAHYAQSNIADATKRAYRREFGIFGTVLI